MALRMGDTVDMGKVEAKVREIEKLRGDGQIARIRANEQAKAQLTAEQRDKLKSLMAERWKSRRERMQQGRPDARQAAVRELVEGRSMAEADGTQSRRAPGAAPRRPTCQTEPRSTR